MPSPLKKGDRGPEVRKVQKLLTDRGYAVDMDGDFGARTRQAVRAFQSQNLDQHGQPLAVDGAVGPLTWWSLTHPKPAAQAVPTKVVDFTKMPASAYGGSKLGRAALSEAISELNAGAREIGGNNSGPFVAKYLKVAGIPQGNSWCASFVSWCYLEAAGGSVSKMAFRYLPGARALLTEFKNKGWASEPESGYQPVPGDLVIWWRVQLAGWQGHVGLVHQLKDGVLYTVEGNRSPRVEGFSYVIGRMEKLLGFGHVPDA